MIVMAVAVCSSCSKEDEMETIKNVAKLDKFEAYALFRGDDSSENTYYVNFFIAYEFESINWDNQIYSSTMRIKYGTDPSLSDAKEIEMYGDWLNYNENETGKLIYAGTVTDNDIDLDADKTYYYQAYMKYGFRNSSETFVLYDKVRTLKYSEQDERFDASKVSLTCDVSFTGVVYDDFYSGILATVGISGDPFDLGVDMSQQDDNIYDIQNVGVLVGENVNEDTEILPEGGDSKLNSESHRYDNNGNRYWYFECGIPSIGKIGVRPYVVINGITIYGDVRYITIEPTKGEAVDLGLPSGIKWASKNLGATNIYDYVGFSYNEIPSDYTLMDFSGTEYDIATTQLGGTWRTPTLNECQELYDNTVHNKTYYNGVEGCLYVGKNGNSIFLPETISNDLYWTATLTTTYDDCYYSAYRFGDYGDTYDCNYNAVNAIRPVCD